MRDAIADLVGSVAAQQQVDRRRSRLLYSQVLLVAGVSAGLAYYTAPQPFSIVFVGLIICCSAVVVRPILGVYGAVFLTMIGDTVTVPWYPFTKNLSSRESIS